MIPSPRALTPLGRTAEPTFGQMFGFMLDSLFMDQLKADLERISRYNENNADRRVEFLVMTPSQDVNEIARQHVGELPRSMRALLRTMGASSAASTLLLSYLLFERGFTRDMIDLGWRMRAPRADEIREFLALKSARRLRS